MAAAISTCDLVARALRLHLVGDDRQDAALQLPHVLGDEDEADARRRRRDDAAQDRADDPLADTARHVGKLAAHDEDDDAGDGVLALDGDLRVADVGLARVGVDLEALAGVLADDTGDRRAIALADEGAHAERGGLGGIRRRQLDHSRDLLANFADLVFECLLECVRPVDALGDAGRQLLRLVLVAEISGSARYQLASLFTWATAMSTCFSITSSRPPLRHWLTTSAPKSMPFNPFSSAASVIDCTSRRKSASFCTWQDR